MTYPGQHYPPPPRGNYPPPPQGNYPPPGWTPPQPPKRRKWPWIVGGVFGFLVLLLAAAVSSAPPSSKVAAPTVTSVPPAPAKAVSDREWQLIAKDPNSHAGERIILYGQVFQFDAATGPEVFLADVGAEEQEPDAGGYVSYPDRVVISGDKKMLAGVVEGDLFTAEVTVRKAVSFDTQIGGNTTVPGLLATSIRVVQQQTG